MAVSGKYEPAPTERHETCVPAREREEKAPGFGFMRFQRRSLKRRQVYSTRVFGERKRRFPEIFNLNHHRGIERRREGIFSPTAGASQQAVEVWRGASVSVSDGGS